MNALALIDQEGFSAASVPSFTSRIRGTSYLWGSASLKVNASFEHAPTFSVRNAKHGDPVEISTTTANGETTQVATLQPGEFIAIAVQGINGITANCATQSIVYCIVR